MPPRPMEGIQLARAGLAGLLFVLASCSERRAEPISIRFAGEDVVRYEGTLVSGDRGRAMAEGIWRFFWRNGRLQALGDFRAGESPGAEDELEDHTQIPTEGRNGHWREWSPSGALVCEGCYVSGLRSGMWRTWYEDGTLHTQGMFAGGKERGEQLAWHPNGLLASRGVFANGNRAGLLETWDEHGELRQSALWRNGVQDGLCTDWDEHGMRREAAQYRNGLLHGARGLWNAQGELTCVSHYVKGELEGVEELFHANGRVRVHGAYEHGEPVGTWVAWNEDGEQIWTREERAPNGNASVRGAMQAQRTAGK